MSLGKSPKYGKATECLICLAKVKQDLNKEDAHLTHAAVKLLDASFHTVTVST